MRNSARLLTTALLSLIAGPAFAQCSGNLPANSVAGRLGIPAGGGPCQAIPFPQLAASLAPNLNWLRVNSIQNPTSGFGLELGYDGTEGVIQSYSNRATVTLSPIFYIGSSHKFIGGVGVGIATDPTQIFTVRPGQTIAGSRVFSISNTENGAVSGAPGPIQLTWGSSNGAPWDATGLGTNANVITFTAFAKQNTFDFVPLQISAHLTAGTGAAIVGSRVQAYIDSTATTPRGGTGVEVLMSTSAGGDVWALNPGVSCSTVACGVMHGAEFDITANTNPVGIHGIAIVGSGAGSPTGTNFITGFASELKPISNYILMAQSGLKLAYGINSASTGVGGAGPITSTGSLWLSGGYTVATGLEWGRMTFSSRAIMLPNNAPIQAYASDATTIYSLINLNTSNLITLGGGATVDPNSGGATFGGSTMANLSTSGTAGGGYIQLGQQSSAPGTPTSAARLYADASSRLTFMATDGFARAFAGTLTAGRVYTLPDVSMTFAPTVSPAFTTPVLGVATATSINFGGSALANYVSAGSWTPADGSGASLVFTGVSANYTRIGNMVFAYGRVTYPATASGASAVISGLPITSANATYATTPCTLYSVNGNTNAHSGSVGSNATTFSLTKASGAATLNSDVTATTVIFHCMYPVT